MITYLGSGVLLGLSAGLSPGPLFALVLAQTLRHGIREGCKVALAPLVTDLPIILCSTFLLSKIAGVKPLLGGISLAGGIFVLFMAYETFRFGGECETAVEGEAQSLSRGILANFLSPHPYLFWIAVGAPTILKGWSVTPWAAIAFVGGFTVCLVGSKIMLAIVVGKSRRFLAGGVYRLVMRFLGLLLLGFALFLLKDGIELLLGNAEAFKSSSFVRCLHSYLALLRKA